MSCNFLFLFSSVCDVFCSIEAVSRCISTPTFKFLKEFLSRPVMADNKIPSVNEFFAESAAGAAQEPVTQGSTAGAASTNGAAASASMTSEQPVQKAIPMHDKPVYKSPPCTMPNVMFDAPPGPSPPRHIGSRPQMTDPSMHPANVMRPLALPNVPRPGMDYQWQPPTPPMSQLRPQAPDFCLPFSGSAPPPGSPSYPSNGCPSPTSMGNSSTKYARSVSQGCPAR